MSKKINQAFPPFFGGKAAVLHIKNLPNYWYNIAIKIKKDIMNLKILSALALLNTSVAVHLIAQKIETPQYGNAVLYSKSLCGKATANGGKLNCNALTAAHRKLPFGTKIRVTNLKTDESVIVSINDRGPYSKKDILDLSPKAAKMIGLTMRNGRMKVRIDVLPKKI